MRTALALCLFLVAAGCEEEKSGPEKDPVFMKSAAAGIDGGDVSIWNVAASWGDHRDEGYLTAESDPKIGSLAAGKLCTSDGSSIRCTTEAPAPPPNSPDVRFLARRATPYTWPDSGSDRTVPFDQEVLDTANAFNAATGTFTAPVTGVYVFNGGAYLQGTSPLAYVYIAAGGMNYMGSGTKDAVTGDRFHAGATAYLTAGQSVTLHAYVSGSTPPQLYGNSVTAYQWTWLQGTLVK